MPGFDKIRVVVVDDEEYICNIIEESLAEDAYDLVTFNSAVEALEHIGTHPVDLVLTDLVMGQNTGVEILETTLANHDDAIVILMTAHPTVQTAIAVLKRGAYDFLVKPFKLEMLRAAIKRGLSHQRVLRDNLHLRGQVEFLKAANAATPHADMDDYLTVVLNSCITELSAAAAAILAIDPASGEINRRLYSSAAEEHRADLLDDALVEEFLGSRRTKPRITQEEVKVDGIVKYKIIVTRPIIVGSRCQGVINLLLLSRFDRVPAGKLDVLTILANSAASAITNRSLYDGLKDSFMQAIRALANAIEARDPYTAGHTDRVTRMAEMVAERLGWSEERISNLRVGCTLHDIGKIGVPDSILNKPTRLTEEERKKMTRHPSVGLKIIRDIKLFKSAVPYIISHHERYDGEGYPKRLKGEEIPIEGRLLAVVDTFDAIMSDRPYRKGAQLDIAVRELLSNSGTQFDPLIVGVFLGMLKERRLNLKELFGRDEDISCLDGLDLPLKSELAPV